ncbi:PIG-L deacetylase family protein [Nocardioides allogilvus]|uniref:PIG-L deacetylase family protein n=1 Tax=Nocardioides allogilvus TaxID=2072017 RepID=UPI000D30826D|nr:PIG-L deacetylase family protein [Nocardioides allogilvus]
MLSLIAPHGPLSVLCLGAHPDDIEIGCGGTLLSLAGRDDVTVVGLVLTGTEERQDEARASLARFAPGAVVETGGLRDGRLPADWDAAKDVLEEAARRHAPDLVLAPRVDDAHQDHRVVGRLAATVWRDALVLHYEIPKWDGDLTTPSHYVALAADVVAAKLRLLDEGFPSQVGRDWWDHEVFRGLLRLRGVECRAPYAEGFHSRKVLLDLGATRRGGDD